MLETWIQSPLAYPQNFLSPHSMAGICNLTHIRERKKVLPLFWQASGPVTSYMHACSESGRHVISLRNPKVKSTLNQK